MKRSRWVSIKNTGISVRLAIIYMLFFLISWLIILFVFSRVSYKNALYSAQALSAQTLGTVSKNVTTLIDNVAYYSRIILSSSDITSALAARDAAREKESFSQFTSLIASQTHINGIYMWDMDNNVCGIDKNYVRNLRTENIKDTTWYQEVWEQEGSYCLILNADKVLTNSNKDTSVSLIRTVNDPVNFKPVGILMINIDLDAFVECYSSVEDKSVSTIYILDDTGKIVSSRGDITLPRFQEAMKRGQSQGLLNSVLYRKSEEGVCLLAETEIETLGFSVLAGVPIGNGMTATGMGGMIFILALIFLTLFCGAGYFVMKYYVADPLEQMAVSMNRMQDRKFVKIKMGNEKNDTIAEMRILQKTYNHMVDEIEKLIQKVYEEEKVKRKAELNVLQEQMKPHFLYNTIDAMSYLALSGKNEEVYDALEAFGSYYRTLLSKGREVIMVKEEINMVRDYLELQKLRYGEILHYVLEVDERISKTYILKMVLQPIVENCVNHGIRNKETPGVVYVGGMVEEGYLKFTVEDDGVGMDESEIEALSGENLDANDKSFGFRGTIERLKIFYELNIDYEIKSKKGRGTTILLKLPILYEEDEKTAVTAGEEPNMEDGGYSHD